MGFICKNTVILNYIRKGENIMSFIDRLNNVSSMTDSEIAKYDTITPDEWMYESIMLDTKFGKVMNIYQSHIIHDISNTLLEASDNDNSNISSKINSIKKDNSSSMQDKMSDVWSSFYVKTKESIDHTYNYMYENSFSKYNEIKSNIKSIKTNKIIDTENKDLGETKGIIQIKPRSKSTYESILKCDKSLILDKKTIMNIMKGTEKLSFKQILGQKSKYTYTNDINTIRGKLFNIMGSLYESNKKNQAILTKLLNKYDSLVRRLIKNNNLNDAMDKKDEMTKLISIYDTYTKVGVICINEIYTILNAYLINSGRDE